MIVYIISGILLFIAYSAKWIMDTLQFHYWISYWARLKDRDFWNPNISYNNKYKNSNKFLYWLFENPLVFLTDGWHLMQFIYLNSIIIVISLNISINWYIQLISFISIRLIYLLANSIFYKDIKIK